MEQIFRFVDSLDCVHVGLFFGFRLDKKMPRLFLNHLITCVAQEK